MDTGPCLPILSNQIGWQKLKSRIQSFSSSQSSDVDADERTGQDARIDIFGAFSIASLSHNDMTPDNPPHRVIKRVILIAVACVAAFYFVHVATEYKEFRHGLTEFHTVRLTDQRADVIYRLGLPTSVIAPREGDPKGPWNSFRYVYTVDGPVGDKNTMPPDKTLEDYDEWVYDNARGSNRLTIAFDKAGQVHSLSWYGDSEDPLGWGPIAGIWCGDTEDKVLRLGHPSLSVIEGATKTIEFSDLGLEFQLAKGRTYMVTVKRPLKGETAVLWRFIHTLP
jgi:hypothetical protein